MLPEAVLKRAQNELLDWHNTGMSVMEISHRGALFGDLLAKTEHDLRGLLQVPEHYKVLFLTSPARAQFALLPLNIMAEHKASDYLITGMWSDMAAKEAARYTQVNIVADGQHQAYIDVPARSEWVLDSQAAYFYYTHNETIHGLEWHTLPDAGEVPLVSDMTSSLLSRPLQIDRFGVIFAGVQKNIAPAGLTVVIIREDLLGKAAAITPSFANYTLLAEQRSLYYTPNTFSCYMLGLMLQWIHEQGGLASLGQRNQRKAESLYQYIDGSDFYTNAVAKSYRSWMNVTFQLADKELELPFLERAHEAGLVGLKGHRWASGMRASIYNGMPQKGIDTLIDFMRDFVQRYA